jgi:hypothetical protein
MKDNGGPRRFRTWVSMQSWLEKPSKGPTRRRMAYRNRFKPEPKRNRPKTSA